MTRVTVVIPTYQRPDWIKRAVRSLAGQSPAPQEVIAVARDTDRATHEAVRELQGEPHPFEVRLGLVHDSGFMPPVREGFRLATGDVIGVLDDDAEAEPGWVEGVLRNYSSADVGAVGGRCINMTGDRVIDVPETSRVGYVTWLGGFIGNMYKRPTFTRAVDVSFLMGGCMSFRADVARRLEFDPKLNQNVAYGYEIDLGLQVRNLGLRLIFDPAVAIRHYSAPRAQAGTRDPGNTEAARWVAYNDARIALRRLGAARAALGWAFRVLVGYRRAPGLFPWLLAPIARALGFEVGVARSALAGRMAAACDTIHEGRPAPGRG